MTWVTTLSFERPRLRPPARLDAVREAERQLGHELPKDFVELLTVHDGGDICAKRYAIYSVGENRHAQHNLVAANAGLPPEYPLVNIGFGPNEDFGYKKSDVPAEVCPVYR